MTTAFVEVYPKPLYNNPFVTREQPSDTGIPAEPPLLPPELTSLQQKVQDIKKALQNTAIDPSMIPPVGTPVLHHAISNLGLQLRIPIAKNVNATALSSIGAFFTRVGEKITTIATAVYKIAFALFRKSPPEVTIEAILDELKLCQAISPAQYEAVLQLSKEPEKKPALMLLTVLLGFSTTELSPLLSHSLNTSPEYAFSLLLECFLIKKFASNGALRAILNEDDRACISKISFEGLQSNANIKEQLRCLRSLSYRSTVRSWIAQLHFLFQTGVTPALTKACTEAIKNNDAHAFARELSPFLSHHASQPLSNESLYAKELLSLFSSNIAFDRLAIEIRHQKFFSQWGKQVTELKKAAQAIITSHTCSQIGHLALREALALLTNDSIRAQYRPSWTSVCSTFRATQEGSIAKTLRKIDGLTKKISTEIGLSETSEEDLKPPKHVLHLACSCGGGHTGMVQALNSSFKTASSHSRYHFTTEALDVPTQVTRPLDLIYSLFHKIGIDIDTTWVYNFLLRNDLCSVIEFLKWLTSGEADTASTVKKQSLIRQAILARDPDFLDMVYAFDGNDLDEVSQQLGLPLLYVATDLDLNDWRRNPTSPFFKEAVPSLQHPAIRSTLHLPDEQVEEIGLCVGPEFENTLSPQQLDAVRARYGIAEHEKVIFFSNGGTALQNTIPERIALEYTDASTPIHLIVACGKNESFKEYLEKKIQPFIPKTAPVKMTVLGYQQRMQMAELSQLADVAIGKPGGMSTMEFVKAGTKVIFDETSFRLHWERFNADVVVNSGRGMIMKNPDQILSLIKESLKSPRRTPMRMAQTRASEQYVDVVHRQLTAANSTAAEHGWREKRRSWHKMNKRMAITTIG